MKKIIIDKIEGYNYYLKDKDKIYNLNIELYGIEDIKNIKYMYISEDLLNDNQFLSFGPLNEKYGKKITSSADKDLIIIVMKDGKECYLKRFYG